MYTVHDVHGVRFNICRRLCAYFVENVQIVLELKCDAIRCDVGLWQNRALFARSPLFFVNSNNNNNNNDNHNNDAYYFNG